MIFILLCVYCSVLETTSAEKHTLQYLYTLRSALENEPEFEITTVFDGLIISHCKSSSFRDQSRYDWISQTFTDAEWKNRDLFCESEYYFHKTLKKKIEGVYNTTNGIIQRERSCTEDDSVVLMSDSWGVNGENFLTLDPKTLKWSSDSPLATPVQSDWNQMKFMTPSLKDFKMNQCKPSLMKLKMKKEEYLKGNLRPKIYIFGKPSHDGDTVSLRCYVSHKYLSGVRVRLTLDGVVVDNVNISSPAPNMDGSVQIRLETKTNIKEPDFYHCVVDADNLHTFTAWGKRFHFKQSFLL
uniref:Ig-like domain-containing protein n=1 Tax=Astyanax mexicanus TaxID=7994 RepID=A0A3B1IVB2_ASTMX